MKNLLLVILLFTTLAACNETTNEPIKKEKKVEKLTQIKNGKFTEWYPGKKNIKFQGMITKKGERNGKWTFYSESGTELSFTFYENGKREGFTVVKYPNGVIHYTGEYKNDKSVGVWKTYNEKGELVTEKDLGYPEE